MAKIVRGVQFPDDATPQEISEYFAADEASNAAASSAVAAQPAGAGGAARDIAGTAAGAVSSGIDALGGLRGISIGAGGLGTLLTARHLLNRRGARTAAPPAATTVAPPAVPAPLEMVPPATGEAKLPSGWQRLTEADFARHGKALKGFEVGDPIQLKELQNIRLGKTAPGKPNSSKAARTKTAAKSRAPGPTIQGGKVVPAPPPGFTEASNPQRGKFGSVAADVGTAPTRAGNVIVGPSWAGNPEGAAAARAEGLAQLRAQRAALRGGGTAMREAAGPLMLGAPAAAALLRHFLSGGSVQDLGDPQNVQMLMESLVPTADDTEPQYGEPGYRGPI